MAATGTSVHTEKRITPSELPSLGRKLSLLCTKCGTTGLYDVGRVSVDPHILKANTNRLEDAVFFSGYFHCRQCGAPGPWDLTTATKWQLLALMTEVVAKSADARISMAKSVLFDGTSHQTVALAEEHLKRLLDENPTDYSLWSRLGNVLRHAEQKQKAVEAYEKAIELNPQDIESHHTLGEIYLEDSDRERAAEHLHAVLRFARNYPHPDRTELLRGMVRASLETLFDLHHESGGKIPLLPQIEPPAPQKRDEPVVLHLMEFDLGRPKDWWRLVDTFLPDYARGTEPAMPPRPVRGAETRTAPPSRSEPDRDERVSDTPEQIRRGARIGRNDPCPCGSGKKFKKCCGSLVHRSNPTP